MTALHANLCPLCGAAGHREHVALPAPATPITAGPEAVVPSPDAARKALRERVLPNYGPTDPGDTLAEWRACVRAIVPDATDEQIDEAIRDAVRDGLMWWDGSEYRRTFLPAAAPLAPNPEEMAREAERIPPYPVQSGGWVVGYAAGVRAERARAATREREFAAEVERLRAEVARAWQAHQDEGRLRALDMRAQERAVEALRERHAQIVEAGLPDLKEAADVPPHLKAMVPVSAVADLLRILAEAIRSP